MLDKHGLDYDLKWVIGGLPFLTTPGELVEAVRGAILHETGVTTELITGDIYYWQSLMAAAVVVAIPVALLYNLFLDRLIAGFTLGAVKG